MQNQQISFMTAPKVELEELKNLFFQLCTKTSNSSYKSCYIEKSNQKNKEDFIGIDKIKQNLNCIKDKNLNSIYLMGAEPLMHPDFNQILRLCLKVCHTTILTSGVMINDKKARFLRKIDDESKFETIYRISLDSTDEIKNDQYRFRGSFRKALSAIFALLKYEFNPIISVVNYENKTKQELFEEFSSFFLKKGFELDDINLKVIPYFPPMNPNSQEISHQEDFDRIDCKTSRVISQKGVYSCPMLIDDYRAHLGSSLDNSSRVNYLDCEKCSICTSLNQKVLVNDWM